ncbi:MAG: AMP-binding protein [candidate division KSB1 bacterium]|nr:AMP-binding protein [candidate division KSB1 bacterium]
MKQKKQSIPGGLVFKYKLATRLVFGKIQAALGGRIVWTVSGAAPLNVDVAKFFHACGILILEGIGMTENTSFTNVNRYDNYKFGTVGPPGPEIEQKIAPDGEIPGLRRENVE